MSDWIVAEEARTRLGVRAQTLYAYVSRGRVQVRPDPSDSRRSLYRAADLAELSQRKARGRKVAEVAASAISWGEPVLASSITTVEGGRLFYRGRDAITLSQTDTLEATARLLRGGNGVALKRTSRPPVPAGSDMRARAFAALAIRAGVDPPARGRNPLALAVEAATLMDVLTDAVAGGVSEGPIHLRLALAWGQAVRSRRGNAPGVWGQGGPGADLIRRALVLLADHELNASTFAARVAASTGASLAASCLAGLAALSGPSHGGAPEAVRELAAEAARIGPAIAIRSRLLQDQPIPGFGHQLYPGGDPRAADLLARVQLSPDYAALRHAAETITGQGANVDFALVAISEALALPVDAPFAIFAVARGAGWIAHAMEQGQTGGLIRPRARYVGPEPRFD